MRGVSKVYPDRHSRHWTRPSGNCTSDEPGRISRLGLDYPRVVGANGDAVGNAVDSNRQSPA